MLSRLQRIILHTPTPEATTAFYEAFLGRAGRDGVVGMKNVAFEINKSQTPHSVCEFVFATPSLNDTANLLQRRGVNITSRTPMEATLCTVSTNGISLRVAEASPLSPTPLSSHKIDCNDSNTVSSLDHVVFSTPNPDRALALYGARLGLNFRLDRTFSRQQRQRQLLFFRCDEVVVEIFHDVKDGAPLSRTEPDILQGLAWRCKDVHAAHARLVAAGVAVSDVRDGRVPGTKVFTVRSKEAGTPTLVIGGRERGWS